MSKKIQSMKLTELARFIDPNARHDFIGIRPGEKLHEFMINPEDSIFTYEYSSYYKILPTINDWFKDERRIKDGVRVPDNFKYSSDTISEWMSRETLKA